MTDERINVQTTPARTYYKRSRPLPSLPSTIALPDQPSEGWSDDAMVLGKLSVPALLLILINNKTRAYCSCSRCGWGCFDVFPLVCHFSLLSPILCETARYRLKYCYWAVKPKPTNQIVIIAWFKRATFQFFYAHGSVAYMLKPCQESRSGVGSVVVYTLGYQFRGRRFDLPFLRSFG